MQKQTMKAARLTGLRRMEIQEVPVPRIRGEKDVLLRMAAVGVCGSDVHYYAEGGIGSQKVRYPHTVGHEGAAVVEAVGPRVARVRPGDRVAIEPAVSCHACDQCRAGRPHTCRNLRFLACPGELDGCLSEYIVMPEECCYPIPATMSLEQAALSEPLSIGVYAVRQSIPMESARIGIFGVGPIGLSVMLPALAAGAERVYVIDPLDYRLRIAADHGAWWAGNPETTDVVAEITAREPLLLDCVFECCGRQEALDQGMQLLKPGGKFMLIGIPEFDRYTFLADVARRKELCFQNVRRQNGCVQAALDLIAAGRIAPDFMITHRMPFTETAAAFDLVDRYAGGVVKAMIEFPPAPAPDPAGNAPAE